MAALATLPAWLPTVLSVASTAIGAVGTIAAGQAAKRDAAFQAQQMEIQAGQERAAAQREADEAKRRTALVLSRQQALASASGLGASDATIEELAAETAGFGAYQQDALRAQGEQRAANLALSAAAARASGNAAATGSYLNAAGTILGGLADNVFTKKYGAPPALSGDPVMGELRYFQTYTPPGYS